MSEKIPKFPERVDGGWWGPDEYDSDEIDKWRVETKRQIEERYVTKKFKPKFTLDDCIKNHERLEMIILEMYEALGGDEKHEC